ncbi:MAG: heavy metal transport/detoxification protein [uncultured bacterium]|nr:MAG: heavy metal transport/detoxification protein [uncultured bacterium]
MTKLKFKIEGMHCTSCAMNIDFDLEDLEGVNVSNTNYAKSETEVEFDENAVKEEELVSIMEKLGYQAKKLI